MYSLLEKLSVLQFIKNESFPFILSLTITELFFKFGSFTLECGAFLVTWYLIGRSFKYLKIKALKP
jgi:hypothetical protein